MKLDFTIPHPLPEYPFLLGGSPVVEGSKARLMHANSDSVNHTHGKSSTIEMDTMFERQKLI